MTLLAHSQLGPYEIVDLLGAGGMGEVYHTLPHDALPAKLDTLKNLRVVDDEVAPTVYRVDVGPFSSWKDVPTW